MNGQIFTVMAFMVFLVVLVDSRPPPQSSSPSTETEQSGKINLQDVLQDIFSFALFNRTEIELCYYHQEEWMEDASHPCQYASKRAPNSDGPLVEWSLKEAQKMYSDYVRAEPFDNHTLALCYLRKAAPDCASLVADSGSLRYKKAQDYVKRLAKFETTVYWCHVFAQTLYGQTDECKGVMDQYEVVEHCWRYHRYYHYQECEPVFWNSILPPTDVKTYFVYTTWRGITAQFAGYLAELEATDLEKATAERCLYLDGWMTDPTHVCQRVVVPSDNDSEDVKNIQRLYQAQEGKDRKFDCKNYHPNDMHDHCLWYDQTRKRIIDFWSKKSSA